MGSGCYNQRIEQNLVWAQERMMLTSDKKQREVKFGVGDCISALARRCNVKLSPRFFGPFQILQHVGKVVCKMELASTCKFDLVFHVSLLKKWVGPSLSMSANLPLFTEDGPLTMELESILDFYWTRVRRKYKQEALVGWTALPIEDATWEALLTFSVFEP